MCPNRQKLGRDSCFPTVSRPGFPPVRERSLLASAALVFVFHWIRTLIGNKLHDEIFSVEKSVSLVLCGGFPVLCPG